MNHTEIVEKYMLQYDLKGSNIRNIIIKLADNQGIETTEKDIEQWVKHQKETMNKEELPNAQSKQKRSNKSSSR